MVLYHSRFTSALLVSPTKTGLESWGCSQPGEDSGETLQHLPVPKEATRELKWDFLQGPGVMGQGEMALK